MSKILIMTDSASDISEAEEKELSIDILPFPIMLDGESYISRVDFDNEQFYKMMSEHDEIPKTSQITPYQFVQIYLERAKKGYEHIVFVSINSKGSMTNQNAIQAIDMFYEENPEYKDKVFIHVFDGIGYNSFYGTPVVNAAKMNQSGASIDEILAYLKESLNQREVFFGIFDLKYAAKSGRIPTAAALIGKMLDIKPIMRILNNEITTAVKCRGEKKMMEKLADIAIQEMEPNSPYQLIYGSDKEALEYLHKVMVERLGYEPEDYFQVGAAIAANAGPKVVGVGLNRKK